MKILNETNTMVKSDLNRIIDSYMKERCIDNYKLSKITGLSSAEINRIRYHKTTDYPIVSDHLIAMCIALRIDFDNVLALLYSINISFSPNNLRDCLIQTMLSKAAEDDTITVTSCNRFFLSEGLMPLTFSKLTA